MPLLNKINFQEDQELINYIATIVDGSAVHSNYESNAEQAAEMAVHLKGADPSRLLESYRPNEPEALRDYRLSVYEPITKSQGERIVNVLSKIQQSSNYTINFPEQKNVPEEENLQSYTQTNYPEFRSLEAWTFNIAMNENLTDANSLVVVMPLTIPDDNVSYLKPFTFIYRSDQVLDYGLNYYTILLDEKNVVKDIALNVYMIVTDKQIFKMVQVDPKNLGKMSIEVLYEFDFGEVPAYFTKGNYRKGTIPFAYDSFVSGILAYWNKAVRMDSDLDAQYNQHLFMERVEMEVECDAGCQKDLETGTQVQVRIVNDKEIKSNCHRCSGTGWITGRTPLGVTTVRSEAFDGGTAADVSNTIAYVDKPVEIVNITEAKVEKLISQGFSSINLDIIDKAGENQSGIAKTIDRSELQSFMTKISDNLFDNIMTNAFRLISKWRYSVVNDVVVPFVNKPTNFNSMNEAVLIQEIKTISEAGLNTTSYEMELIERRFPNDLEKQAYNKNVILLDPLAGRTEDEKADIKLNGGVTQEQFIVSSNIRGFILDAIETDREFLTRSRAEKQKKLAELAKAQIVSQIPIQPTDD